MEFPRLFTVTHMKYFWICQQFHVVRIVDVLYENSTILNLTKITMALKKLHKHTYLSTNTIIKGKTRECGRSFLTILVNFCDRYYNTIIKKNSSYTQWWKKTKRYDLHFVSGKNKEKLRLYYYKPGKKLDKHRWKTSTTDICKADIPRDHFRKTFGSFLLIIINLQVTKRWKIRSANRFDYKTFPL